MMKEKNEENWKLRKISIYDLQHNVSNCCSCVSNNYMDHARQKHTKTYTFWSSDVAVSADSNIMPNKNEITFHFSYSCSKSGEFSLAIFSR